MEQEWLDGLITHASSGATPEPATRLLAKGAASDRPNASVGNCGPGRRDWL